MIIQALVGLLMLIIVAGMIMALLPMTVAGISALGALLVSASSGLADTISRRHAIREPEVEVVVPEPEQLVFQPAFEEQWDYMAAYLSIYDELESIEDLVTSDTAGAVGQSAYVDQ